MEVEESEMRRRSFIMEWGFKNRVELFWRQKTGLGRISKEKASGNIILKNIISMEKMDKLVSIACYQINSFCSGQMDGSQFSTPQKSVLSNWFALTNVRWGKVMHFTSWWILWESMYYLLCPISLWSMIWLSWTTCIGHSVQMKSLNVDLNY